MGVGRADPTFTVEELALGDGLDEPLLDVVKSRGHARPPQGNGRSAPLQAVAQTVAVDCRNVGKG
jgi:hypothetical protein